MRRSPAEQAAREGDSKGRKKGKNAALFGKQRNQHRRDHGQAVEQNQKPTQVKNNFEPG
jgi:hypothetical protein